MKTNPLIDGAAFIPLVRTHLVPLSPDQKAAHVRALMKERPYLSRDEAHRMAEQAMKREEEAEVWASPQYTVLVYRDTKVGDGFPSMDWLSIRRDDRAPVRDWRHMQAIKNQICGRDREGVELYPHEDRLVDTANQFHLWVLRDADACFPFGFSEGRNVSDDIEDGMGAVQRRGSGA
jgi:hypothetical protein